MADMCPVLLESVMKDYSQYTNLELVRYVFGDDYITEMYHGMIASFFVPREVLEVNQDKLGAATELVERWANHGFLLPAPLSTPELIREFVRAAFGARKAEGFAVLILDIGHELVSIEEMFHGAVEEAPMSARKIVRRIIGCDAVSVIFVHYRPGGDAEPGSADRWFIDYVKEVLVILEVEFVDYIVVGGGAQTSLAERGLLS